MKLSEAIRLGSVMKPQNYGAFYGKRLTVRRRNGFPWLKLTFEDSSCALGAAYEAEGGMSRTTRTYPPGMVVIPFRGKPYTLTRPQKVDIIEAPSDWHGVFWHVVRCPACSHFEERLSTVIPHLNDKHRWTREAIARFVEGIENQHQRSGKEGRGEIQFRRIT
jgi:hypothetical protein